MHRPISLLCIMEAVVQSQLQSYLLDYHLIILTDSLASSHIIQHCWHPYHPHPKLANNSRQRQRGSSDCPRHIKLRCIWQGVAQRPVFQVNGKWSIWQASHLDQELPVPVRSSHQSCALWPVFLYSFHQPFSGYSYFYDDLIYTSAKLISTYTEIWFHIVLWWPYGQNCKPQQGPGEDEELGRSLECALQAIKVQGHGNI